MQGRAAGRGGARSAAARVAGFGRGGLGWSRRGGTPDTRSSAGARGRARGRAAAGARAGWNGWWLKPAAPASAGEGAGRRPGMGETGDVALPQRNYLAVLLNNRSPWEPAATRACV